MTEPTHLDNIMFGVGHERCPETGRPYECGSGALSKEQQTANYVRERDHLADMPKEGEVCPQTGREYECGSGCGTKSNQTRAFIAELPEAEKRQRAANAAAL